MTPDPKSRNRRYFMEHHSSQLNEVIGLLRMIVGTKAHEDKKTSVANEKWIRDQAIAREEYEFRDRGTTDDCFAINLGSGKRCYKPIGHSGKHVGWIQW